MMGWLDKIFNFDLAANPANWLIVYIMAAFFILGVTVLHAHTTQGS